MNINQAVLISFVTNLAGRELATHEIGEFLEKIKNVSSQFSESVIDELLKAMKDGKKIEAIKCHRSMTGSSLLDAKNAIERHYAAKPNESI